MSHRIDSIKRSTPYRLTLISAENAELVKQAAETTGYDVRVEDAPDSSFPDDFPLAMVTHDERSELGPFWREYERLKKAAARPSDGGTEAG